MGSVCLRDHNDVRIRIGVNVAGLEEGSESVKIVGGKAFGFKKNVPCLIRGVFPNKSRVARHVQRVGVGQLASHVHRRPPIATGDHRTGTHYPVTHHLLTFNLTTMIQKACSGQEFGGSQRPSANAQSQWMECKNATAGNKTMNSDLQEKTCRHDTRKSWAATAPQLRQRQI